MATEIRVETDDAPDAWDRGGYRVVCETPLAWQVVFRGDVAECEDMAESLRSRLSH